MGNAKTQKQNNVLAIEDIVDIHNTKFNDLLGIWEFYENYLGGKNYAKAQLGMIDRYYLLIIILHRYDAWHPWLYDRCREIERETDECIDLWAREHYKSTLITFAGIIQEIIRDPEITICIFSHTKPIAKKFWSQIRYELENNEDLKSIYSNIFYNDPSKKSPRWSEEKGLCVKRKNNPKEATIEAYGLVDGQPTSAHYALRVYDDVVTLESVSTPDQINKTTEAWELSDNLGARGKDGRSRRWMLGTRYHFGDTYQSILDRKIVKARIYPATEDGTPTGNSVFLTQEVLEEKRITQGRHFAAQMLQNPAAGDEVIFQESWLKYIDIRPMTLNIYITVDPARSQKKGSDNTAMIAQGIDANNNKYLLDGYYHKMDQATTWILMRDLRKKWLRMPGVQRVVVGYERYGLQGDIEHFKFMMRLERDEWEIIEVAWPREGSGSKIDRIERLAPDFRQGRYFLPMPANKETSNRMKMKSQGRKFLIFEPTRRRDHEGNIYTLQDEFLTEYKPYPFSARDDFLDSMSRIYDLEPLAPLLITQESYEPESFVDGI